MRKYKYKKVKASLRYKIIVISVSLGSVQISVGNEKYLPPCVKQKCV